MRQFDLLRGAAATGALLLLACGDALASPPTPAPENGLMGVSLMVTYRTVLSKFGQPQEIQVSGGGAAAPAGGAGAAPGGIRGMMGMGGPPGGLPGFPGGGPPMGMAGMPGGMGGYPGGKPSVGPMGVGGSGGAMGGRRGMMMGGGGPPGGLPGFPGGGPPTGTPGMPGMAGMGGFPGGMMGGGARNNSAPAAQATEEQETTWWYHFPQKGLHVSFLFNHEGRVIQVQEYGWKGGTRTRQGIGLGSTLGQIIQRYGWSNDGEHSNVGGREMVTLRYGGNHKVAFQLVDNKVVGITLGVVH